MITPAEIAEAQAAVDLAVPEVRNAIADLEVPWSVCKTGLEVVEPPPGEPYQPYRVVLERFGGMEHTVIAVPSATSRFEAIRIAGAHCREEHAAYQRAVSDILRKHGVTELLARLKQLKEQEKPIARLMPRESRPEPAPKRVLNPLAPDAETLAERDLARTNKW
jgi:hypothetical protein